MLAAVRSELTRLRQPRLLVTWFGLMTLFALMINTVMVTFVSGGESLPPGAPGVAFPTFAEMESPSGLMAGLAAASNKYPASLALSMWAVVTAGDYGSGLIRLLVAAEPRRWPLLAGKDRRAAPRDRGRDDGRSRRERLRRPAGSRRGGHLDGRLGRTWSRSSAAPG